MPPLYINWTDGQKQLYALQQGSSHAFGLALGAIATNYAVSEWILNSRTKEGEGRRRAPSYIVSAILFWGLYTAMFYSLISPETIYYIVVPLVAFLSFVANLAFEWAWNGVAMGRSDKSRRVLSQVTMETTVPLLGETEDIESLPIPPAEDYISEPATKPKETVDYINNIKIFLTVMVILFHCARNPFDQIPPLFRMTDDFWNWGSMTLAAITATDSSYFMSLFFFYSGYFVPKSYDKKGRYEFLLERAKRLGIPFVVFTFLLGPYLQNGLTHVFFGLDFPAGVMTPGPAWFLNILMQFSVIYAFACGKNWSPKIECPSLLGCFGFGVLTGVMTFIIILFADGTDSFFGVPFFWRDFPTYPLYFFAGAIAQRNNWMDVMRQNSRLAIYSWAVAALALDVCFKIMYGWKHVASPSTGEFMLTQFMTGVLYKGILQVGLCLAVTVFFMDHCNKKYRCTPFFSKAMYTAYILQTVPVLIGLKVLLVILEATGNVAYNDDTTGNWSMYITNSNLIFPGWLLVCVIALLIDWPLAYAVRSIPGFSEVL